MGLATAGLVVLVLVVVMAVYHTFRGSEDEASTPCLKMLLCCQYGFRKALPLAPIKTVVVVWQIITQVCLFLSCCSAAVVDYVQEQHA